MKKSINFDTIARYGIFLAHWIIVIILKIFQSWLGCSTCTYVVIVAQQLIIDLNNLDKSFYLFIFIKKYINIVSSSYFFSILRLQFFIHCDTKIYFKLTLISWRFFSLFFVSPYLSLRSKISRFIRIFFIILPLHYSCHDF